jgi:hypothetical protein
MDRRLGVNQSEHHFDSSGELDPPLDVKPSSLRDNRLANYLVRFQAKGKLNQALALLAE